MTGWIETMLESKKAKRKQLADLPFAEKIEILERLRERRLLINESPLSKKYKGQSFSKP